ncbi:MAG: FlgD immunoglobulin-like domain containing protein [Candidatus Eisenbacteria bacterium]|nr:FlgD immunoglobulin-like domain containing protein [Candidatus Eisenbacteria bacterium]
MAKPRLRVALFALSTLLLAGSALALHAPEFSGPRPGPHASEISAATDPLDAVPNGLVNRTSGVLASLVNLHDGPFPGTPEQAARAFLAQRAGDFGLSRSGDDLAVDAVQQSPGNVHVRMHQTVGGVPVLGADVVVTLDAAGRIVEAVYSAYDPILAHSAVPSVASIPASRAREAAVNAVGVTPDTRWIGEISESLWVIRDEPRVGSPAHLAFRVSVPVETPMGDWVVDVDALSGSVLRVYDQAFYTDGSGMSFDPDPITTAEVVYGGNYSDNNDQDNAYLSAERFPRSLRDITLISGMWNLRGPWVYLEDFESPVSPPVTNADPNAFNYSRFDQGFEDVMAYFGIDQSQRYIQSLGYNNIQHGPIHVDPHGLSGADNSHYIPSSNKIAWGEGGVDDAEDMDVLLHEYGHALQNSMVPGWGGSVQARSMGEGFGDYWAGSYSQSISDFRSEWVFNWDGHNTFWGGRALNSTLTYQNINGDIYHDGSIWAAVLWLIRSEVGRKVSDDDVLKLHFGLGTGPTMAQAAASMMQADKTLYGGLHAGSIDFWMVQRRFFTEGQYDVPSLTHVPIPDQNVAGPYPLTVTIASGSPIVDGSVKVKFGTGTAFDQEAVLAPTGNPNEWGGAIPNQGGNVDIRYYLIADNTATWRGASPRGAENLYYQFHVGPLVSVEELQPGATLALYRPSPNPCSPMTSLRFDLPQAGNARFAIHDLQGRTIRTLADGALVAGRHTYSWDGRDQGGHPLPAGLYFVRLEAEGRTMTEKVLLTK